MGSKSSESFYTKHYKWNGSSWTSLDDLPYNFYGGCAVNYDESIYILGTADDGNETLSYVLDAPIYKKVS